MFTAFLEESRREKATLMKIVETQQNQIDFLTRFMINNNK